MSEWHTASRRSKCRPSIPYRSKHALKTNWKLKILCVCDCERPLDFHVVRPRSSPTRPPQSWEQEEARKETYSHYVLIYLMHFPVLVHYIQKSIPPWPQSGVSGFISPLKSNMFLSLYCDRPSPNPPALNEPKPFQSLPPLPLSPIAALSLVSLIPITFLCLSCYGPSCLHLSWSCPPAPSPSTNIAMSSAL